MRLYGLLEPRRFKLTPLAEKLTYGTEQDKKNALQQAILNIPLWKELYSNFGVELPDSNFWVQLQKITGLDPLEAQKYAETVRKAYLDDVSNIKPEKGSIGEGMDVTSEKVDTSMATSASIEAQANIVRGLILQGAFEIAKNFIDFIAEKVKTEKEEPEEGG